MARGIDLKRWLAVRRWWVAAITALFVVVRIAIAAGFELVATDARTSGDAVTVVTLILDVLALGTAVVALVAFVQYGRIFKARVPTE